MQIEKVAPSITRIADTLFAEIKETGQVTDEQLSSLQFLFEKHWTKALQIVDHGGVFCFVAEKTGRRAYQVQGQSNTERYTVFPSHYCSCQAFFFDVVSKSESPYCKHQLAALIADALGKTRTNTVDDLVVAELLQQ